MLHSNTLATWCKELTHLKRPWCWERLKSGGEGDDRGWDGWMASPTQWTWVWMDSRSWWWTGRPGVLRFMGSQRVGHDWATELNWTETLQSALFLSRPASGGADWQSPDLVGAGKYSAPAPQAIRLLKGKKNWEALGKFRPRTQASRLRPLTGYTTPSPHAPLPHQQGSWTQQGGKLKDPHTSQL